MIGTLVSLHYAYIFRLLLKISVEGNKSLAFQNFYGAWRLLGQQLVHFSISLYFKDLKFIIVVICLNTVLTLERYIATRLFSANHYK